MSGLTRDRLIAAGLQTMLKHGYEGAGLATMLAEAGIPKGSFYHFFKSKDAFTIAVINAYALKYKQLRERIFGDETMAPLARLSAYFRALEAEIVDEWPASGCLYGVLSQTIGVRSRPLRAKLLKEFRNWELSIQDLLDEAKRAGDLPEFDQRGKASLVIDLYEGVLVRMKTEDTLDAFAKLHRFLRLLLGSGYPIGRKARSFTAHLCAPLQR